MKNYMNYIADLAATMVINGTATINNAIELALKKDSDMTLNAIKDLNDMQKGYINKNNNTQKAYQILLIDTYNNLNDIT